MSRRILVVEDEILVALDVAHTLETAGFHVIGPCATLDEGLEAFSGEKPDGAVLDVQLGEHDVFPLARELHRSGVPIVFHSGHAEADELSRQFPSARLCSKPCSPQHLAETIGAAISASAPPEQASRG